jgi:hypothetical protein
MISLLLLSQRRKAIPAFYLCSHWLRRRVPGLTQLSNTGKRGILKSTQVKLHYIKLKNLFLTDKNGPGRDWSNRSLAKHGRGSSLGRM